MEQKEQLELLEEETTKAVEAIQEAPAVEASQKEVEAKKEAPAVQEEAVEEKVEELEQEAQPDPRVETLKTSLKKERLEVKRLQDSIKGLLEGLIADLPQEDKDLVSELGGEQPDRQLAIFNKLKKAGKIGASQKSAQPIPAADRTRIASGEGTIGKPQGWKEADKRVSRRLKQVN